MKSVILISMVIILSLVSCVKEPVVYVEVIHKCSSETDASVR